MLARHAYPGGALTTSRRSLPRAERTWTSGWSSQIGTSSSGLIRGWSLRTRHGCFRRWRRSAGGGLRLQLLELVEQLEHVIR